jgi:hypothetical protein
MSKVAPRNNQNKNKSLAFFFVKTKYTKCIVMLKKKTRV